jgi:hypothetical protein
MDKITMDNNSNLGSLIKDTAIAIVTLHDRVSFMKGSPDCVIYLLEHSRNCANCQHELSCAKVAAIMSVYLRSILTPESTNIETYVEENTTKILNSNSVSEVLLQL